MKRFYFSSPLLLVIVCCGFVISAAIVFKSLFTSFLFLLCYNLTLHKKGRTNQLRFDFWGQVLRDGQEMKTCFALVLFALYFKYLIIVIFYFLSLINYWKHIYIEKRSPFQLVYTRSSHRLISFLFLLCIILSKVTNLFVRFLFCFQKYSAVQFNCFVFFSLRQPGSPPSKITIVLTKEFGAFSFFACV